MASNIIYLRGTAMWCKHNTLDKKFKTYTMDLYPDDDSWVLFKAADTELKIRDGELNGEKAQYIKIRRQPERVIAGDVIDMGPPKAWIVNPVSGELEKFEGNIGNGSQVVCKITVYPTAKGNGHRWEAISIEKLVEYESAKVLNDEEFAF